MAKTPNPGGRGPKVTAQAKNKGPIIGKMTSPHGVTAPWSLNKGSNRKLNAGKDVKKS